ncbi:hypothetical protein JZ751_006385 [Albula glossodonta]|uniref:ZBR-type domain-containing protein n=1 Tax=Albula glossodonta TaxID=121402 RepID=A0A8T2N4E7_9TELE|nr:hypothetical protein JZ751_006385 [Albula glossodonta]
MKSPFTKPELPLIYGMDRCDKEVPNRISPKKSGAGADAKPHPPPPCVKAIDFYSGENVNGRGAHNKENHEDSLYTSNTSIVSDFDSDVVLGCSGFTEDSGYGSPVQLDDASPALTPAGGDSLFEASPSDPKLPVLQFQRAVCKELREGYRKNRRFDWAVLRELAGRFGLHNVIGGKIGLEYVDVLQALMKREMKHILTNILLLLEDVDLVNCKKVSRTWRRIICSDPRAKRRCVEAEKRLGDLRPIGSLFTRDIAPSRVALTSIQGLSSTPIPKPSRPPCASSPKSRFREYQQVGSTVKQHESLKACRRCGFPAKCDPGMSRATCTRQSCGFESCTLCQAEYHGSTSCRLGVLRTPAGTKNTLIIGSAQSRRNVKRL